jgi:hypothetical protein
MWLSSRTPRRCRSTALPVTAPNSVELSAWCSISSNGNWTAVSNVRGVDPYPGGGRLEVDGGTDDPKNTLLVEAWAHQGPPKPAQRAKVLTDAFKLSFAATLLARRPRLFLLFSDKEAAAPFRSPRTCPAAAIQEAGIEVIVVDLPDEERARIRDAQRRQYRWSRP